MSDASDAKTQAHLESLAAGQRETMTAMGRVLQEIGGVRHDVARLTDRVMVVEGRAERAERLAAEAARKADGAVHDTGEVHNAWKVHAAALRQSIDSVQTETVGQSATLAKLEAAEDRRAKAEELSAAMAAARSATMDRVLWWLKFLAAVGVVIAGIFVGIGFLIAHTR